MDQLTEIINIGVGKAAQILNTILQSHIVLSVPRITLCTLNEVEKQMNELYPSNLCSTTISFKGVIEGDAELVFPSSDASKLVGIFAGDQDGLETEDMDTLKSGAMSE